MSYTGTVSRWNGQKGFGFITCDNFENDVFVHFTAFGGGDLIPGAPVQFDLEDENNEKPKAANVTGQGVTSKQGGGDKGGDKGGYKGGKGFGGYGKGGQRFDPTGGYSKGGKGGKGKGGFKGQRDFNGPRGYDDYNGGGSYNSGGYSSGYGKGGGYKGGYKGGSY